MQKPDFPPIFLMSPPRRDWGLKGKANFKSQTAGAADAEKARREWTALADAIVESGGEVVVCPPNPRVNLTGMIYTAEAGELYRDRDGHLRFLLPHMSAAHRRPEADWIGGFFEGLGIRTVRVDAVWEAQGDAIRGRTPDEIIHTFGQGAYQRTDRDAYAEIAPRMSAEYVQIGFVADPWFHGNTFMNVYHAASDSADSPHDHILLVCAEALQPGEQERLEAFLPDVHVVPITAEESRGYDTNSLQVGDVVLAPSTLSATAERAMLELDLTIHKLDLSELFLKGGGAPVCMTNRLWNMHIEEVPEHTRWSLHPRLGVHTEY